MTPAATPSNDSARVRALVVEAVAKAADLIATPATAERWDQPSTLEGMTVGALSAHLVRAAGATIAYLDRTPPERRPDGDLLTAVTYFHAAVDSPIHDQIKDVSATESAIGHEATVAKCRQLAADLETRLADEPTDRLVAALGGRLLTLNDFCRTRLIEVLLHLDDLAVSTGQPHPATDPKGAAIIIEICINIARDHNGDWGVLYALTRAERSKGTVFPVF